MSRSQIGLALMILGGAVVVVAGLGWALSAGGDGEPTVAVAAEDGGEPNSLAPAPVTTPNTATTVAPAGTTTTAAPETTTTISAFDLVAGFIAVFAQAIDDGDLEFVFSRLHPDIVGAFGEELCRSWVEEEILALAEYELDGAVSGPSTGSLDTPIGTLTFEDRYTAPVTFLFGGQRFSVDADFVVAEGEVYFTGTCGSSDA